MHRLMVQQIGKQTALIKRHDRGVATAAVIFVVSPVNFAQKAAVSVAGKVADMKEFPLFHRHHAEDTFEWLQLSLDGVQRSREKDVEIHEKSTMFDGYVQFDEVDFLFDHRDHFSAGCRVTPSDVDLKKGSDGVPVGSGEVAVGVEPDDGGGGGVPHCWQQGEILKGGEIEGEWAVAIFDPDKVDNEWVWLGGWRGIVVGGKTAWIQTYPD